MIRHRRAILPLQLTLLLGCTQAIAQTSEDAAKLAAEGEVAETIDSYRMVVAANPDDGEAWYGLGRLLHDERRYVEAREVFERAKTLGFQPAGADLRLGMIAIETGDPDSGREHLAAAAEAGLPVERMLRNFPVWETIEQTESLSELVASLHPCASDEHRAFDFWIGEWDVYSPAGRKVGENRIEKILSGCVLMESWQGGSGSEGRSFNRYDPPSGKWVQRWVNDSGTALDMRGSWSGERMQLVTGHEEGQPVQRWIWTPLDGGRVRQMAEELDEESGEWRMVWDSIYIPKGEEFGGGSKK